VGGATVAAAARVQAVHLPARHGRALSEILASIPEVKEVLLDGTERPISRPEHKRRRDAHYSGRRRRTTVKNVLVTAGRRVVLLTPTVPGRRHDKTEADLARVRLAAAIDCGPTAVCKAIRPERQKSARPTRNHEVDPSIGATSDTIGGWLASASQSGACDQFDQAPRGAPTNIADAAHPCGGHRDADRLRVAQLPPEPKSVERLIGNS
jgi:hypothetical protein